MLALKFLLLNVILFIASFLEFSNLEECDYTDYWYFTGRASISYSNGNIIESAKHFKKAFAENVFAWGNDLDLALKIAVDMKDTLWANQLSIQLAKGGIPLEHFYSYQSDTWYPKFQRDYATYKRHYEETFNVDQKTAVLALIELDREYNEKFHRFRRGEIELTLTELVDDAEEVRDELTRIIKTFGFPSEKTMGYYYHEKKVARFPLVVLLIHIFQRGDLFLKPHLNKLVCKGYLRPPDQALLNGSQGYGESSGIEDEMIIKYNRIIESRK